MTLQITQYYHERRKRIVSNCISNLTPYVYTYQTFYHIYSSDFSHNLCVKLPRLNITLLVDDVIGLYDGHNNCHNNAIVTWRQPLISIRFCPLNL